MAKAKVVCQCGHDANEHALFTASGCLFVGDGKNCRCDLAQSDILYQKIYSLETDVIQARRVADERQEIIKEMRIALEKIRYKKVKDYENNFAFLVDAIQEIAAKVLSNV